MAARIFRTDGGKDVEVDPLLSGWGVGARDNLEWVRLQVDAGGTTNLEIWDNIEGVEVFYNQRVTQILPLDLNPDEKRSYEEMGLDGMPFRIEFDV